MGKGSLAWQEQTQTDRDQAVSHLAPMRPRSEMKVGGQQMTFTADTGAKHSVVTFPVTPFSKKTATILGATGT